MKADRPKVRRTLLDRAIEWLSPERGVSRLRNRVLLDIARRNYDAADMGRRTDGWNIRRDRGVNVELARSLPIIRERSRDLVRNNPWGASIVNEIVANLVHHGIIATFGDGGDVPPIWLQWAESPQCDALRRKDFYAIQQLAARTWAESGECFVRRVWRSDWKPGEVPFALQVLEPEYIDHGKDGRENTKLGIKFDASGTAQGYHVYRQHPGDAFFQGESVLVPAADMIHVYSEDRPGQIRGVPLMAPVILRLYDLDTFEQAELQKQEVASLFAGFRKKSAEFRSGEENPDNQGIVRDRLEPGTIEVLDEGEDIVFSNPPQRSGYGEYVKQNLMAVAAGAGLTYEAVSGDYGRITFLNGRLGQLRFHRKIDQWQWFMLIPQFCRRVAEWFREGAAIAGQDMSGLAIGWQPPVKPMVDPEKEVKSTITQIRAGLKTQFEAIAEHGNDPVKFLDEYKAQIDAIDERKLVFVTDARKMSGAEQLQQSGGSEEQSGQQDEKEGQPEEEFF